ncbi:small integral membrane protein 30-like [Eubalaena glacialis]|uniref:small integral membrane protein 30-like n=1 Tax=Eubalaena glacialis TaxID=27606 RepID=UPI002A59A5B7|nr:small integral membrane protein 30-like [Eubalaena glacialis]
MRKSVHSSIGKATSLISLAFKNQSPQDLNIKISVSTQLFLVLFSLLLVLPVVEAVEAGDAIALLLSVVLSITGICACLGVYARKRNGQM